ncbi:DUF411 domain-containing protein [Halomontanus rarus]|uniref:DUF411 domain-containing protein n=1 Tax=Halomontanus rarus TaxID=3034020 RepID=UPI0023E8EA83|nr:DUF411 domain-containing protein [Halovivax sp. TS33]
MTDPSSGSGSSSGSVSDSTWSRRALLTAGGASASVVLSMSLAGCLGETDDSQWETDDSLAVASATQYSAPNCNCCEQYASYLDDHLETDLDVTVPDDIAAVKREYGVPAQLGSCHTLELDGYVVEGHVPVEAIATLFDEEPSIDGIALPEMPAGSPGMPGEQSDPFTIYAIDGDGGEYEVFTEL